MEARDIPASMQEIYYQKDPLTLKGKTEKAVNMLFQRQESILAAGGTKLITSCGLPSAHLRIICIPDF